jgi:hypothetical protein
MSNNIPPHSTGQIQTPSSISNYGPYLDPFQRPQKPDSKPHQFHSEKARYKQERDQWRDYSGELLEVIDVLDRCRGDLHKQLEDERYGAKLATDRMQRLLETKDASMGRQFIDDNKPKNLFATLLSNVKKVIKLGITGDDDLKLSFDTESSRHILHRVAPILSHDVAPEQLFRGKEPEERLKRMRYFLRGYVTYILCDEILPRPRSNASSEESRQADHWAEAETSKSIWQIENSLIRMGELQRRSSCIELQTDDAMLPGSPQQQITQSDICTWRAMTVDVLTRATAEPTQNAQRTADNTMKKMLRYFPRKEEPLCKKLYELCQEAISLSQILRQQRAQWHVYHPSDIKLANFESWVEDAEGENLGPSAIVEFYISPALVKSGNIDGERYDIESCIAPAVVSCRIEAQDQEPQPAPPTPLKALNGSENNAVGRSRSPSTSGFSRNDSTLNNPAKVVVQSIELGTRNRKEVASGETVQMSGNEIYGCSEYPDRMPRSSTTSFRGSTAADEGPRIQRKPNVVRMYSKSLEQKESNDRGSPKPENLDLKALH